MRLNIDQITVYQSLFINKANVNRGSRNGMTCNKSQCSACTGGLSGHRKMKYKWKINPDVPIKNQSELI